MNECRTLTNVVGNSVATLVVSRWEGELDAAQLRAAMSQAPAPESKSEWGCPPSPLL